MPHFTAEFLVGNRGESAVSWNSVEINWITLISRLVSRCFLCPVFLQHITQSKVRNLPYSSRFPPSPLLPLNQPPPPYPPHMPRLNCDVCPCPVVRIRCLPPEESLLSIAMLLVSAFFVNESTRGPFFGSWCLLVSIATRTASSASAGVLSSAEGCDVSVILGDCDWLIVPQTVVWPVESLWLLSRSLAFCPFVAIFGGQGIVISGWCLIWTWDVHLGAVLHYNERRQNKIILTVTTSDNLADVLYF